MGKSNRKPTIGAVGKASNLPKAYVPTWEIPVALKGAQWAIKGGEKLVDWFVSEGPLSLQVLDSHADGTKYTVEFRATNLTVHSIYIDSFTLTWPQELVLSIAPRRIKTMEFGQPINPSSASTEPKSTRIQPGQCLELIVEFPTPKPTDLETGMFKKANHLASAKVQFWILNEKASRDREVVFALRLP